MQAITLHGEVTRRGGLRYQFTPKHHGLDRAAAQWLPELSLDEEFAALDTADALQILDSGGNLYGLLRDTEGECRFLGTLDEQIAEFPASRGNEAWHGYPSYPVTKPTRTGRIGQAGRPETAVPDRMRDAGLITPKERKILMKGENI